MSNKPLISVIIPIYNGELFLAECLNSIINQTLKNIEIICIDDGSTDNTFSILNKFKNKDSRIKIYHQKNNGAGSARNFALTYAAGKYLSFLDVDDIFELNMLETAFTKAETTNADIVVYRSDSFYETDYQNRKIMHETINLSILPLKQPFCSKDVDGNIFKLFIGWAWDKLIKAEFIKSHNLIFQEQRTTNDALFVFMCIILADKIVTIDTVLAHHRNNKNSLANTREKSWWCFYDALIAIKNSLIDNGIYQQFKIDFINYAINFTLWNYDTLAEPSRSLLHDKLKNEWLDNLGISSFPIECVENKYEFYRLSKILLEGQKNCTLSVIIPTYNNVDSLSNCLNSIIFNKAKNVEILCIDGVSNDNTLDLLNKYNNVKSMKCPFTNYVHQIKMGVLCATGKYILLSAPNASFENIDFDDLISELNTSEKNIKLLDLVYLENSKILYKSKEESVDSVTQLVIPTDIFKKVINNISEMLDLNDANYNIISNLDLDQKNLTYIKKMYASLTISRDNIEKNDIFLDLGKLALGLKYYNSYIKCIYTKKINKLNIDIRKKNTEINEKNLIIDDNISTINQMQNEIDNLHKENEEYKKELNDFNSSISYRIGRFITYIPRKIFKR